PIIVVKGERPVPTNSKDNPRKSEQIFSSQCQTEQATLFQRKNVANLYADDEPAVGNRQSAGRNQAVLRLPIAHFRVPPNWWSLTGSNRRHPACKAGALPAELRPQFRCLKQSALRSQASEPLA